MKTLLRIDSSIRKIGSHSRRLADLIEKRWKEQHADACRVLHRDLATAPPPHLDAATFEAFQSGETSEAAACSNQLIDELQAADAVLLSAPNYNFSIPSTLKAYLDQVIRFGRTMALEDGQLVGQVKGKPLYLALSQGAVSGVEAHHAYYLEKVFRFLGFTEVHLHTVRGTADESIRDFSWRLASREVDVTFSGNTEPAFPSSLTADDREAIRRLRHTQAIAIETGDADLYASSCTDDVELLLPSTERISGRPALHAAEEDLFARVQFTQFRKQPHRLEGNSHLVIETGEQQVTTADQMSSLEVSAYRQKYTHVYRRTDAGWKFALLMSNPSPNSIPTHSSIHTRPLVGAEGKR